MLVCYYITWYNVWLVYVLNLIATEIQTFPALSKLNGELFSTVEGIADFLVTGWNFCNNVWQRAFKFLVEENVYNFLTSKNGRKKILIIVIWIENAYKKMIKQNKNKQTKEGDSHMNKKGL